jgi:hypothetical protein
VVWFDPSVLPKRPETHAGIDDESLLIPTLEEPAEGLGLYEEWRSRRTQRRTEGILPSFLVQAISQLDTLPDELGGTVEMITIPGQSQNVRPKSSRKYGDVVHALLAGADFPVNSRQLAARAAMYDKGGALSNSEREMAVQVVVRALNHPLLNEARRAQRIYRECPVMCEIEGELFEGVIDLVWFDGVKWTIVDFKTGQSDMPQYQRQLMLYGEAVRRSKGDVVRLIIFEVK